MLAITLNNLQLITCGVCILLTGACWGFIVGETTMFKIMVKEQLKAYNKKLRNENPILERNDPDNISAPRTRTPRPSDN